MSTTTVVDEKVVEMKFDNREFEANVRTSMRTLDTLKKALNFRESTKSVESLSASLNKVDVSPLAKGFEAVTVKINGWEMASMAAINNIVNRAIDAGVSLTKSLSTDNIVAGWTKYGDKTTSVATLVSQGYGLETVNEQLERLNWFTDETSYNFTDMVSNIAKFTATGQDLESSVTAMEGIATWAAKSGQNAQKASSAMYQLAQAMGKGALKLDDYKSIQNVSMDTDEFRQACLDAAVQLGKLRRNADDTYETLEGHTFNKTGFTEYLTSDMWLSSEVMMSVFNRYSSAVSDIYEYSEKNGITASEAIKEMGTSLDDFGLSAFKAAQEARTWSDVVDSVKDAVSTGWMNTFTIIFGEYEQAKTLFTDLANVMYDIFAGGAERRNDFLSEALNSTWKDLVDFIKEAHVNIEDFQDEIGRTFKEIEGLDISNVITEYGSLESAIDHGAVSIEVITKALMKFQQKEKEVIETNRELKFGDVGDDVKKVQQALNDLGYDFSKWGMDGRLGAETQAAIRAFQEANNLKVTGVVDQETLDVLNEFHNASGVVMNDAFDILNSLNQLSGRELLSETLVNLMKIIVNVKEAASEAWDEIFPESASDTIYDILKRIHDFVESLLNNERVMNDVKKTFMGLFSVLKIVKNGFTLLYRIGSTIASKLFPAIGGSARSVVLGISDFLIMLGKLSDQIIEPTLEKINGIFDSIADGTMKDVPILLQIVGGAFYGVGSAISYVINALNNLTFGSLLDNLKALKHYGVAFLGVIKDGFLGFWESLSKTKFVSIIIDSWTSAFAGLSETFKDFKIPKFDELKTRLKGLNQYLENNNKTKTLVDRIVGTFQFFYESIKAWLKPSTDIIMSSLPKIGTSILEFFKNLWAAFGGVPDSVKQFFRDIKNAIRSFFDWWKSLSVDQQIDIIKLAGMLVALWEFHNLVKSFGEISGGFNKIGDSFKMVGTAVSGFINALKGEVLVTALKSLVGSLVIIVACIYALVNLPADEAWNAVGMIIEILGALVIAQAIITMLNGSKRANSSSGLALSVLAITQALYILIQTFKELEDIKPETIENNLQTIKELLLELGVVAALMAVTKGKMAAGAVSVFALVYSLKALLPILVMYADDEVRSKIEKSIETVEALIGLIAGCVSMMTLSSAFTTKSSKKILFAAVAMIGAVMYVAYKLAEYSKDETFADRLAKSVSVLTDVIDAVSHLLLAFAILSVGISAMGAITRMTGGGKKNDIDPKAINNIINALTVMVVAIGGVAVALSFCPSENVMDKLVLFLGVAGSLFIMFSLLIAELHFISLKKEDTVIIDALSVFVLGLAALVWALGTIQNPEPIISVLDRLILVVGSLGLIMGLISHAGLNEREMLSLASVFGAVSVMMLALAGALKMLNGTKVDSKVLTAFSGLMAISLIAVGLIGRFTKAKPAALMAVAAGILAIASAMLIISFALSNLMQARTNNPEMLLGAFLALVLPIAALLGAFTLMATVAPGLIEVGVALLLIAGAVWLISKAVTNALDGIIRFRKGLIETATEVPGIAQNGMEAVVTSITAGLSTFLSTGIPALLEPLMAGILGLLNGLAKFLLDENNPLFETLSNVAFAVIVSAVNLIDTLFNLIGRLIDYYWPGTKDTIIDYLRNFFTLGLYDIVTTGMWGVGADAGTSMWDGFVYGVTHPIQTVWEAIKQGFKNSFFGSAITVDNNEIVAFSKTIEEIYDEFGYDANIAKYMDPEKQKAYMDYYLKHTHAGSEIDPNAAREISNNAGKSAEYYAKEAADAAEEAAKKAAEEARVRAIVAEQLLRTQGSATDEQGLTELMKRARADGKLDAETYTDEYIDTFVEEAVKTSEKKTETNNSIWDHLNGALGNMIGIGTTSGANYNFDSLYSGILDSYDTNAFELSQYSADNPMKITTKLVANDEAGTDLPTWLQGLGGEMTSMFNVPNIVQENVVNVEGAPTANLISSLFGGLSGEVSDGNSKLDQMLSWFKTEGQHTIDRLSNAKVVMDSGALVGQIATGMNQTLGQGAVQSGRWNVGG